MKTRLVKLVVMCMFSMPLYAWGNGCSTLGQEKVIKKTEALIKQSVDLLSVLGNPYDVLLAIDSACTLLSFDISEHGIAESIQVVKSEPRGVLDRAAIYALKRYQFYTPASSGNRSGMLLFILSRDKIKEYESQNKSMGSP